MVTIHNLNIPTNALYYQVLCNIPVAIVTAPGQLQFVIKIHCLQFLMTIFNFNNNLPAEVCFILLTLHIFILQTVKADTIRVTVQTLHKVTLCTVAVTVTVTWLCIVVYICYIMWLTNGCNMNVTLTPWRWFNWSRNVCRGYWTVLDNIVYLLFFEIAHLFHSNHVRDVMTCGGETGTNAADGH